MRKIVLLITALALVAVGAYFLLRKSSPPPPPSAPKPTKIVATKKPSLSDDFRPKQPHDFQSSRPQDTRFDEKERYADPYFQHSHIQEDFHYDSEDLYDYMGDYDYYSSPYEHDEYSRLYEEMRQEQLFWEYQQMLYDEMNADELQYLSDVYSDYDVERWREAELEARRWEYDDYVPDEYEWKNTSKDKKDALKKLSGKDSKNKSSRDKDDLSRLNEASKNQTPDQLKKVQKKLDNPAVKKAKAIQAKVVEKAVNKIKKVAKQPEEDIALFQIKKGENKIFVYSVNAKVPFDEALPKSLQKKVLKSDLLIEETAHDDLKVFFDDDKKSVIALEATDPLERIETELEAHKDKKIVIAIKESRLYGDKGLLKLFSSDEYSIMYFNKDLELVKYPPPPKGE